MSSKEKRKESTPNPKSNPYIKSGINKKFLTPCPQIGLSRNFKPKTPNSSNSLLKNSPSTSSISTPPNKNTNKEKSVVKKAFTPSWQMGLSRNFKRKTSDTLETPPKTSIEKSTTPSIQKETKPILIETPKSEETKPRHETVAKTTKTDDSNSSKKRKSQPAKKTAKKRLNLAPESPKKEANSSEGSEDLFSSQESTFGRKKAKILESDSDCSSTITYKSSDSQILTTESGEGFSNLERMKSEVLVSSFQQTVNEAVKSDESEVKQPKKFKRLLSLKKSTEEEVLSRNSSFGECSVKLDKLVFHKVNIDKISVLIAENDKKVKVLDDLKRAECCAKKNNIDEVRDLTKTWKNGCIAALNDLLPKLQSQSDIDMATLLRKIAVPDHLIKIQPDGELG